MLRFNKSIAFGLGILAGAIGLGGYSHFWGNHARAWASNDRHDDYVMCTGQVLVNTKVPSDGVWLLDYRSGRLLGTVIDHSSGTIRGWAEVDLVQEFGLPPRQDARFLMTTGQISQSQSALYITEINSGKFGVYTMGVRPDKQSGISIRRQNMSNFRTEAGQQPKVVPAGS